MLKSNSIRFGTDEFGYANGASEDGEGSNIISPFKKFALLIGKRGGGGWDCRYKDEVTGFELEYSQPTNCYIRLMFNVNQEGYYRFVNGNLELYSTEKPTLNQVLYDGNRIWDLVNVTKVGSIPGFVGKSIWPIIALQAPSDAEEMPWIKIGLNAKANASTELQKTVESEVIALTTEDLSPQIASITPKTSAKGNGSVDIKIRLRNGEEWTDYMALDDAVEKEAQAVQFKYLYKVSTADGSDSVTVKNIVVAHTSGRETGATADGTANLYSTVIDYEVPLQRCNVIVRHEPLLDSEIQLYVNFMHKTEHREKIQIGTGTGSRQELSLGLDGTQATADPNVVPASLELYADGIPINDYSYNSVNSTVAFNAKKGAAILASYDYGNDSEVWRQMTHEVTEPFNPKNGLCTSYYHYLLPDEDAENKTISNIRLRFRRLYGTVTNENLGTTTGKKMMFVLAHRPNPSTIEFSNSKIKYDYDNDNYILTITNSQVGLPIEISYKWIGAPIAVRAFTAAWSVA